MCIKIIWKQENCSSSLFTKRKGITFLQSHIGGETNLDVTQVSINAQQNSAHSGLAMSSARWLC